MPSVDGGCILLARRFFTSWVWNLPHHQRIIALWLIYRAHWKREPRKIATSRGPIVLERGQLWTTRRQIAKECGVTPKQARGTLTILERNGFFWADRRAGLGMVVTICNYDRYQDTDNYKRPTKGPTQGRPRADPGPYSESGNQGNQSDSRSEPPADAVLALTCTRGEQWHLTPEQIRVWRECFPAVDVVQQIRHAAAWMDANPTKRKTRRGMARFLVNWLGKAQNSARGPSQRAPEPTHPRPIPFVNRPLTDEERAARRNRT